MAITLVAVDATLIPYNGQLDSRAPSGELLPSPNVAPVLIGAPASLSFTGAGPHTFDFSPYASDANGDAIAYSLTDTRTGVTVNSSTGVITIDAVGTVGDVTLRLSDGLLTSDYVINVRHDAASVSGVLDFHPGHYITTSGNNVDETAIGNVVNYVNARSYLKGVVIRPFWNQLEGALGVYDFSLIDYALANLNSDKYLWVQLQTAIFNSPGSDASDLLPAYLTTGTYDGGAYDDGTDVKTKVWNEAVMDRKIALIEALADSYNTHPNFEGIVTGETAMSLSTNEGTSNYSPTALSTQLQRLFPAARAAFSKKQLLLYANYISGSGGSSKFPEILSAARTSDYVLGGPDSLYLNPSTGRDYINGVLGSTNYRGKVGIQVGDQTSGLNNSSYNIPNLFSTCFTALPSGWNANYGFWLYSTGSTNFNTIMSYISSHVSTAQVSTYPTEFPT
jgi:hypothetical protein